MILNILLSNSNNSERDNERTIMKTFCDETKLLWLIDVKNGPGVEQSKA